MAAAGRTGGRMLAVLLVGIGLAVAFSVVGAESHWK